VSAAPPAGPPPRAGRPYRLLRVVAAFFAFLAAVDVFDLVARPGAATLAALVGHLAMVAAIGAVLWAGDAPAGSPRRRVGTGVSVAALVAMAGALLWRLRAG
jgi:hypothetical protein